MPDNSSVDKLCPLKFHPEGDGWCLKSQCAWWLDGCCAILSLAADLSGCRGIGMPVFPVNG